MPNLFRRLKTLSGFFSENFGETWRLTCPFPPPPASATNIPNDSICLLSTEFHSDPLSVSAPMSPQYYLHCRAQFATASAPHSFAFVASFMNLLTTLLWQAGFNTVWHINHLECPASKSRIPVESRGRWAAWTHARQWGHVCLFPPFKPSCKFEGVFILVLDTSEPASHWGFTSFLPVVNGCSPRSLLSLLLSARLAGPAFEFSGSFT